MVLLAAFAAGRGPLRREQVLVTLDALLYAAISVLSVRFAPGGGGGGEDGNVLGSLALYITLTNTLAGWRHIRMQRAPINKEVSPHGVSLRAAVTIADKEATPAPPSLVYYVPLLMLWISLLLMYAGTNGSAKALPAVLLLAGAWSHYLPSRIHGDHRGGTFVPTLFALMIHVSTLLSAKPSPQAACSLHRILILFTYFFTGFRKLYKTGFRRWTDGKNLQTICAMQGLYHDLDLDHDGNSLAINFALAKQRGLCQLGSIGVVVLQLLMPTFLIVDRLWPGRGAFVVAFWLAISFHMANLVLWRINFLGSWCPALLVLVAPVEQVPVATLWTHLLRDGDTGLVYCACILVLYFVLQLGHAMNEVSEKVLGDLQATLLQSSTIDGGTNTKVLTELLLRVVWVLQSLLLGDYYAGYWPEMHPLEDTIIACVVVKWDDGSECLLPAAVDFYWRRLVNTWIQWPRSHQLLCEVMKDKATPGCPIPGVKMVMRPLLTMQMSTVIERVFEHQYRFMVSRCTLDSIHKSGGTCYLRVRALEQRGTEIHVQRLWERKLNLAQATKL